MRVTDEVVEYRRWIQENFPVKIEDNSVLRDVPRTYASVATAANNKIHNSRYSLFYSKKLKIKNTPFILPPSIEKDTCFSFSSWCFVRFLMLSVIFVKPLIVNHWKNEDLSITPYLVQN